MRYGTARRKDWCRGSAVMLEVNPNPIRGFERQLTEVQKFFRESEAIIRAVYIEDSLFVAARKMRDEIRKPGHYYARLQTPRRRPGRRVAPKSRSVGLSRKSLRARPFQGGRFSKGRQRPDQLPGVVFGKPSNDRVQAIHVNVFEYGRSVGGAIRPNLPLNRGLESVTIRTAGFNAAVTNLETLHRGTGSKTLQRRLQAAIKRRERAALSGISRRRR